MSANVADRFQHLHVHSHYSLLDGAIRIDPLLDQVVIERRLKKDPGTAKHLEKARERRTGLLLPADYWPNLDLIGCWKGGTVGTYLDKFPGWEPKYCRGHSPKKKGKRPSVAPRERKVPPAPSTRSR